MSSAALTPLLKWQGIQHQIWHLGDVRREGRRRSVWVLFTATTERQFQVKSDIRKFLRGESTFLLCRVFRVLFIFKFYRQIFLLQCIVHVLSSLGSFQILSKVLMYSKLHYTFLTFLGICMFIEVMKDYFQFLPGFFLTELFMWC